MMVLDGKPTIFGGYGGDYCCKEFYDTVEQYFAGSDSWHVLTKPFHVGRRDFALVGVPHTLFPQCSGGE